MRSYSARDPFFAELDRPVKLRGCDCPGCNQAGDYKAPKNRDNLNDYYWFCLNHVREYNLAWDFFAGMSPEEVEAYTRTATVWERPSWPLGDWQKREQQLRDTVARDFFGEDFPDRGFGNEPPAPPPVSAAEREALAALALQPPVAFAEIKAQYRLLVKQHHPDANGGSAASEEKFKLINQAFTTLRLIYGRDDTE